MVACYRGGMKALTLRMPDETYERLRRIAYEQHISMNEIILASLTLDRWELFK